MESHTVNICGRANGPLYQNRTKLPVNGPAFIIMNKPLLAEKKAYIGPFVHLAVHSNGHQMAASDSTGNIFVFDFKRKKFWRVYHLGIYCCTSLAFTLDSRLIAGISDCSITVWNIDQCMCVSSMSNHRSCVHYISVNDSGTKAITSSIEEAILWDLTTDFHMLYVLTENSSNCILKVFFLHVTNLIVCAFKSSLVYIWDSENLKYKTQFTCSKEPSFWLKAIEGSKDGKMIVCGGKSDTIFLWEAETGVLLRKIKFSNEINSILHILLLSNQSIANRDENISQIIAFLSQSGKLYFYDLESKEYVNHLIMDEDEPINLFLEFNDKLILMTSSGKLNLYNINSIFEEPIKHMPRAPTGLTFSAFLKSRNNMKKDNKPKKKKIQQSSDMLTQIKELLLKSNEYPETYRNFIWAQLLRLPRNDEFTNYYNNVCPDFSLLGACYNDVPETLRKGLARQLSMLIKWCPLLKEVEYLPDFVFPFVLYLHKHMRMCFELLVTLISNWCRYWFLYLPFPPYNILYAIENLLVYIDRPLLHHFLMHKIPPDVYAFYILQTNFSKIFTGDQWLQLWDHLFSNPPYFIIFVVIAFMTVSRNVLLQCKSINDIHAYYSQDEVLVSNVLEKAYHIAETVPLCFDLSKVVGPFLPLPEGGYPPFTNFTPVEANLQTLHRHRIVEQELDYSFQQDLRRMNLEELKKLSKMREKLFEESLKLKDADELEEIERKVEKVQNLVEKHLVTPVKYLSEEKNKKQSSYIQKINDVLQLREKLLEDG